MFHQRAPLKPIDDSMLANTHSSRSQQMPLVGPHSEQTSTTIMQNRKFLSSNILLNRILEKHNVSRIPMGLNTRNFYSNLDLMTIKWAASLNQRM
jgi:hypothetical protein